MVSMTGTSISKSSNKSYPHQSNQRNANRLRH